MVANGKRRKSQIFQLMEGDQTIRGHEPLKSYIIDLQGFLSLDEDRRSDITKISPEENEKLTSIFIEQEVKEIIF
jgi:hypothetical protein